MSEPGSFARFTFAERIPQILAETIRRNDYPAEVVADLRALGDELRGGPIAPLHEDAPDVPIWRALSEPWVGGAWLDAAWFWAETYYYRRVLEAVRYFQPGPLQGHDTYARIKAPEWGPSAAPAAAESVLSEMPAQPEAAFAAALQASLWGNRIDLSYRQIMRHAKAADEVGNDENLLVDDTDRVYRHLNAGNAARVDVLADNAGTELALDLVLIDHLLAQGLAGQVALHLKPQPFFVSDALPHDLEDGLAALPAGGEQAAALAARLRAYLRAGRLRVDTHWFYPLGLFYFQLPADLHAELAAAHLVIVKGDLNYRRLVGDAHWPPTTPFAEVVAYFPAPVVALRTLKAEVIVGLPPGQTERLQAEDPAWMVNGKRGVIQSNLI